MALLPCRCGRQRRNVSPAQRVRTTCQIEEDYVTKHYVCHRSGVPKSREHGIRARTSKIVSRHRTSFSKANMKQNGIVTMGYYTEQTGHDVTASSFPSSDGDRQAIGHYLQLGNK
ncbi:hypothetical protein Aduo_018536 [Ancylostoma duodenale]